MTSTSLWQEGGLTVVPVYLDGVAFPRPLSACDIWRLIAQGIEERIEQRIFSRDMGIDFQVFKEFVQPVLQGIEGRVRVIVLFDEIEPILVCSWANEFLGQWRALLSNTPSLSEYFAAVFVGAGELALLQHDVGSPLMDVLEWRRLRPLDKQATRRLMEDPIGMNWDDAVVSRLFDETGGHPMLTQYIMQQLYSSTLGYITRSIEEAAAKIIAERAWQFSEWWTRCCSPVAQRIYITLPQNFGTVPLRVFVKEFGQKVANDALGDTCSVLGIVSAEDDGFAFRRCGQMFSAWHAKYGITVEAAVHDSHIHSALSRIHQDLAVKYASAWRIYQADLPNYSGAVSEIRDALTLLLQQLASDDEVMRNPGFSLERDQTRPTRRQRVRHVVKAKYRSEQVRTIIYDLDLLETECEQIAHLVTTAFSGTSALTHTVSNAGYRIPCSEARGCNSRAVAPSETSGSLVGSVSE